ncbi:MAG TPA: OmpH family outer membrane protein [Sedimentisphaerales bacterium]|nr:OmpH family outer membrane protein [Sedimentisphaerales bacterium]
MKTKALVLSCLACAVILSTGYFGNPTGFSAFGQAPEAGGGLKSNGTCLKIGVLSIRQIFRESARIARYRQDALVERKTMEAKLDKLATEIDSEEKGLNLLSPGTSDYVAQLERIYNKRASYQADKELYNKKVSLKEQMITEELYGDILRATREVAEQKGLDLVLEKSEPELPAQSPAQLELAMGTHKVLYSTGCVDISKEVLARIDTQGREKVETNSKKTQ